VQRGAFAPAIALLLAFTVAACGTTKTETKTVTAAAPMETGSAPPEENVLFGHIDSLARKGDHYELRFDPAWFLSGETANAAAAEDGAVEPGEPVPNDNYVVDEGHRLFTYRVPANAHVTVLADGVEGTPITVAELAQLVKGKDPLGQPLWEPLETGVWILIEVDTVRSIDQQYVP
jgi:hypothetical protein